MFREFEWDYAVAITPGDTSASDLDPMPIGLHVTDDTSGNAVKVRHARQANDEDGTFSDVDSTLYLIKGDFVKLKVKRIFNTGTTADTVLGLYRTKGGGA